MPKWAGIRDYAHVPNQIWLSREKETDEWEPLRHVDCDRLNKGQDKELIHIENGRATADPTHGAIFFNFEKRPTRQLISATWFIIDEATPNNNKDSSKKLKLTPMKEQDAQITERLYQKAIFEGSSLGSGLDRMVSVTSEAIELESEGVESSSRTVEYEVKVAKRSKDGHYVMKKCQKGSWLGAFTSKSYELQRGYGAYEVEGEEEEAALGPVNHVMFVIHGIGEAMWSREDVMISSLGEQITTLRRTINQKKYKEWKQQCEALLKKVDRDGEPQQLPPPPDRVEFIPIEWYDHIHSSSSSIMKSLQLTTLKTIPALRTVANDVIFDVLMYLTPNFCFEVLEYVSKQIHEIHQRFQQIHPEFASRNGKFSLMGHSLGSVICWDLLSILKGEMEQDQEENIDNNQVEIKTCSSDSSILEILTTNICGKDNVIGYQHYASEENATLAKKYGGWGPTLPADKKLTRSIPFLPDSTVFIGSPVGLFLTLRGAHAVFDDIRLNENNCHPPNSVSNNTTTTRNYPKEGNEQEQPLVSPFALPTGSLYNIFHPSDPVAYRMEPLLLSQKDNDEGCTNDDQKNLPPPRYLRRIGEDIRLHVKVRAFSDQITKTIINPKASLSYFTKVATESSQRLLENTIAAASTTEGMRMIEEEPGNAKKRTEREYKFPLGGRNNDRVDYQMQPSVIDNEYVSAVMAHNYSSYFDNVDIQNIIIDLTASTTMKQQH